MNKIDEKLLNILGAVEKLPKSSIRRCIILNCKAIRELAQSKDSELLDYCLKCGNKDLNVKYINYGELITSSSDMCIEDEFCTSSKYGFYFKVNAKKEHLHKHCRNCQYNWRENVKQTT